MGTIEQILLGLLQFFQPLATRIEDGEITLLLNELGLNLPASTDSNTAFQETFLFIKTNIDTLTAILSELIDAIKTKNTQLIISKSLEASTLIKSLLEGFITVGSSLKNDIGAGALGISNTELDNFISNLPKKLFDFLVIYNIENGLASLADVLEFFKVIDRIEIPSNGNPANPSFTDRILNLNEFKNLITNPNKLVENYYDWGKPTFDGSKLFAVLSKILLNSGIPLLYDSVGNPSFLNLIVADVGIDNSNGLPGVFIEPSIEARYVPNFSINQPGWTFKIEFIADLDTNARLSIFPSGQLKIDTPAFTGATILTEWNAGFSDKSFDIISIAGGSKLEARNFNIKLQNRIVTSGLGATEFEARLEKLKTFINLSDGDGFVSNVSSGSNIESEIDLRFGYATNLGVYIEGSGAIEIKIPTSINIGPIEIMGLLISLGLEKDKIPLVLGGDIKAILGPITVVVENIGLKGLFSFPSNNEGNLGPLDIELGFKPPTGVGLAIDASAIKGGGYLFFDHDREEYAGALELVFSEWIALKAIGLITTKMPDDSKGFSMVLIITAEFGSGIQLGFGFTLLGVGGIVGVNRVVNVDPLKVGVRTGTIESILFPQDVVANAPRIISDLKAFFPVQEGQFLIGPMAKIGYGTPVIASIALGVIIEFPDVAITILGVVKVVLPDEEADTLRLQVNFLGRIEPSNKLLWFYAELYDSRILTMTLEGGMGLLVSWGDDSNFVFSVGGFHPKYNPPPLPFPSPPRLAISILNEPAAKIRIEGYFAVTSNTVQFGARAELYFGFSALKVEGHLGFDVLIQFSPFYFIFEFSAGLSVKVFGFGLFSISISGMLEGPSRWHIKGKAKWKITWLGPTIKVNIDETWGQEKQIPLPPIQIFPLIEREFTLITNWQAVVPNGSSILVSLRKLDEPQAPTSQEAPETRPLILHPIGKLRVSQRKIPLLLNLDKLGNQRPSDVNRLSVVASITGGATLDVAPIKEKFARGEFKNLSKSERLSSPDFEDYHSGIELRTKGEELQTSMAVKRVIRYETIIIDNNFKRFAHKFYKDFVSAFSTLNSALFSHYLKGNVITKSTISATYQNRIQPNIQVIELQAHEYSIAHIQDNTPVAGAASFTSQAMAMDFMRDQIAQNPSMAEALHVIPNTEVNQPQSVL